MDGKAASNLRLLGYFVLFLCGILIVWPKIGGPKLELSEALGGLATIGIGLLLLAEVGPFLKSLKAGGIEVEFVETLNDKFNALEKRIAALELSAAVPPQAPAQRAKKAAAPEPPPAAPARERPITVSNDQNKGRFGGKAEVDGYKLSASFTGGSQGWVEIHLKVEAPADAEMGPQAFAEFYMHETFDPDMYAAPFVGREATTSVLAYGGFTVGVWIPDARVELELDLSRVPRAPRAIRQN